ncbi:M23 family metallopeptidase [Candidatus Parcubacteria bacterium]|nr:M23 family metallopeptidase [Candidatus Parcubacteria bacterium]
MLRGLVNTKRGIFFILNIFWKGVLKLNNVYKDSLGFLLYKVIFYTKKHLRFFSFAKKESKLEFFGRRGMLQILLFVVVFSIMLPHSKLYTKGYDDVAGRNSLLYKIVGPGTQQYDLDEITLSDSDIDVTTQELWKQGSLVADPSSGSENIIKGPQDLSAISVGGSALTKPTIMPGVDVSEFSEGTEPAKTGRADAINYTVQSGDVIGVIAEKFGISISTILWANDMSARSYIRPGQELVILPMDGLTYKVSSGDTVSKIARKYDADMSDIIKHNKLQKDGADIVVGEVLLIPGGEKPRPVYTAPRYTAPTPSSFKKIVAPAPSVSAPAGSGYLWPTTITYISQYYGWRHGGLDLAGKTGSPVYATKAGTVLKAQCGWNWGFGCYVHLDHGNGIQSLYAHASQLYVSPGDYVSQGQTIMASGNTGNSTGPHLHFEIRINGVRQNPLAYIRR